MRIVIDTMTLAARLEPLRVVLLMARQELLDKQRNQLLGPFWLLLQPLAYILLFSTVFSHFMRAKLGTSDDPQAYSIYLISGVLLWTAFANVLSRLSTVYTSQAGLLRKIPMSLAIMPLHVVLVEAALYLIAMSLFVIYLVCTGHPPDVRWLMLPIPVGLLLLLAYALGVMLGLIDVFLPDIRQLVQIGVQFGFWMTPIVYPVNILPHWAVQLLALNPVWWALSAVHDIVVWRRMPALEPVLGLAFLVFAMLVLLRWMKRRLERDLRDML